MQGWVISFKHSQQCNGGFGDCLQPLSHFRPPRLLFLGLTRHPHHVVREYRQPVD
jgi:hypothetical protein